MNFFHRLPRVLEILQCQNICKYYLVKISFIYRYRKLIWRREGDSNPRYGYPYTRFPGEPFQPLRHLSGGVALYRLKPPLSRIKDALKTSQGQPRGATANHLQSVRGKSLRQLARFHRDPTSWILHRNISHCQYARLLQFQAYALLL